MALFLQIVDCRPADRQKWLRSFKETLPATRPRPKWLRLVKCCLPGCLPATGFFPAGSQQPTRRSDAPNGFVSPHSLVGHPRIGFVPPLENGFVPPKGPPPARSLAPSGFVWSNCLPPACLSASGFFPPGSQPPPPRAQPPAWVRFAKQPRQPRHVPLVSGQPSLY
jgi:hypothetical protein